MRRSHARRLLPTLFALGLVVEPLAGVAAAQSDKDTTKIGPSFLDRTYVIAPWGVLKGDGNLIFEAQVRPTLTLFSNVDDRLRELKPDQLQKRFTNKKQVFIAAIVPEFNLRIYNQNSSPVKTPSEKPHLKIRWGIARVAGTSGCGGTWEQKEDCFWRKPRDLGVLIADVGHYSNGQDGCLFAIQKGVDGDCVPSEKTLVPLDRYETNKTNGSFSIGLFARFGIGIKRYWMKCRVLPGDDFCSGYPIKRSIEMQATYEFQPNKGALGGLMPPEIRRIYGDKRVKLTGRLDSDHGGPRFRGTRSVSVEIETNSSESARVPKVSFLVEAAYTFAKFKDAGLFLRYYQGQDYYNVHFLEKTRRVQFGLVFEQLTRGGIFTAN